MRILFITITLLTAGTLSYAQENEQAIIADIETAYNNLNYTEATIKANSALENYQRFSVGQLATIHKILGLIHFSENRQTDARREFESALELNPDLRLDPLYVSPKILDFFEEIRAEAKNPPDEGQVQMRYVLVKDPRLEAAWRSMLFPGWGQRYKGEKRKGLALSGVWLTAAGGTVISYFLHRDARDRYESAIEQAEIDRRYNTMNKWYKVRNNLAIAAIGVYLYSYLDALFKGVPDDYYQKKAFRISPAVEPEFQGLAIQLNF